MIPSPSPKRLREHQARLAAFRDAYNAYLQGGPQGDPELRQHVIDAIPAGQRAMNAAGVNPVVTDPPAMGAQRQVYTGLANLAFLHEHPGFRPIGFDGPAIYDVLLDGVSNALAELREREQTERARRRNPLYWLDRGLRTIVAIPAYIVSLVVGQPVVRIDRSAFGLPLRILGIVADGFGVYFGGKAIGLW